MRPGWPSLFIFLGKRGEIDLAKPLAVSMIVGRERRFVERGNEVVDLYLFLKSSMFDTSEPRHW